MKSFIQRQPSAVCPDKNSVHFCFINFVEIYAQFSLAGILVQVLVGRKGQNYIPDKIFYLYSMCNSPVLTNRSGFVPIICSLLWHTPLSTLNCRLDHPPSVFPYSLESLREWILVPFQIAPNYRRILILRTPKGNDKSRAERNIWTNVIRVFECMGATFGIFFFSFAFEYS